MPHTRISLSIPTDLLRQLDKRARATHASRSRAVADAVRLYLEDESGHAHFDAGPVHRVSEATAQSYASHVVAESRRRQLQAALALSPAQRLERADELARLAPPRTFASPVHQIASFASYDDYYDWKRVQRAGA